MTRRVNIGLIDRVTGCVRVVFDTWHDTQHFNWFENNWSCDCNRAGYFGFHEDTSCNMMPDGTMRFPLLWWYYEIVVNPAEKEMRDA